MKALQELRQEYALAMLLDIAQLPKATFYYHLKRQDKVDKYARPRQKLQLSSMRIKADTVIDASQLNCTSAISR